VQRLHVALPGDEPVITEQFEERTALLGGAFAERDLSAQARKKIFVGRSGHHYELSPEHVITMELYEDKIIPSTFEAVIGPFRFAMARMLGAGTPTPQPLQTMAQVGTEPRTRQYLFNIEIWHEALFIDGAPLSGSVRSQQSERGGSFSRAFGMSPVREREREPSPMQTGSPLARSPLKVDGGDESRSNGKRRLWISRAWSSVTGQVSTFKAAPPPTKPPDTNPADPQSPKLQMV